MSELTPNPPVDMGDCDVARDEGKRAAQYLVQNSVLSPLQVSWMAGFLEALVAGARAYPAAPSAPSAPGALAAPSSLRSQDLPGIGTEPAQPQPTSADSELSQPLETQTVYSADNPFSARIQQLTAGDPLTLAALQIVVDTQDSGLVCYPGVLLGLTPTNDADVVRNILRRLRATGQEAVVTTRGSLPAWQALLEKCSVSRPTPALIAVLAKSCRRASDADELRRILDAPEPFGGTLLELLSKFPSAHPSLQEFFKALDPLMPRLFPVAGYLPGRPHLVEALLMNRGDGASGFVAQMERGQLGVGDTLPIFLHANLEGRFPEDPTRPAIVVATGASMACAAFFLSERSRTPRSGRNWLFTCTMEDSGLAPYSGRLSGWQASRVLTRLDVSPSPSLTERILAQAEMLRAWFVDGCILYCFGSAAECDEWAAVFARVLRARSTDNEDAHSGLAELRAQGQLRIVVTE